MTLLQNDMIAEMKRLSLSKNDLITLLAPSNIWYFMIICLAADNVVFDQNRDITDEDVEVIDSYFNKYPFATI